MKISDERYHGKQKEAEIMKFPKNEQETTINYYGDDDIVDYYTSITRDITKILKIITHDENITVLTVDLQGKITSLKAKVSIKNISLRKQVELSEEEKARKSEQAKNRFHK